MNAGRRRTDPWHERFFTIRASPALVGALLAAVIVNLVHAWYQSNQPQAYARDMESLQARVTQLEQECRKHEPRR